MSSPETVPQPETQPVQVLQQMMTGTWIAQSISVVATLGVADLLADGPKNADQLASATSTHADSLYRVMRALASVGVFLETVDHRFSLTPVSGCLRSDSLESFRNASRMMCMPLFWRAWGELLECVKTGQTGMMIAFGQMNPFEYFEAHPQDGAIFNNAMTEISRNVGPAIAAAYDFGRFRKIVDAGGGHGSLLVAILRRYASPRGVVFDLPHVVKDARPAIEAAGLAARCEAAAGDLLESLPSGADAYVMKAIIHGFDQERAVQILRNVRRAIAPEGRLLVIDRVVPSGNERSPSKLADLQMLVMSGGRERSPSEFDELFQSAGFRVAQIHATAAPQSIVEGIPV
jgi:SAM-dependent methyltransferase